MFTHNHAKGMEQMRGSQVDMHTYPNPYTHSNQGLGAEKGCLAHTNEATQGDTYVCRTMQGVQHMLRVR